MDQKESPSLSLFEFLCLRMREIGIRSIHGVPGDFNLTALDHVVNCGLKWVGNCNELNAGYAADGYARVNGISALMTIMGVGELSALNAIAGSFAEFVPVVHIINMPSRRAQNEGSCIHHTFGDGDFGIFKEMSARVSCMAVTLDCPEDAPSLVDAAIRECWIQSRPTSIFIPSDLINVPIKADWENRSALFEPPTSDLQAEEGLVTTIVDELTAATRPIFLIGGHGIRNKSMELVLDLIDTIQIPTLSSASGRGLINEDHVHYAGLYVGSCSNPGVINLVASADLVISFGSVQSDLGTAGFTGKVGRDILIDIQRNCTTIRNQRPVRQFIDGLLRALQEGLLGSSILPCLWKPSNIMSQMPIDRSPDFMNGLMRRYTCVPANRGLKRLRHSLMRPFQRKCQIRHEILWPTLSSWLQCGDVILAEAGTSSFGIWQTVFARDTTFIGQYLWASIGYTVGACQGAALAVRDSKMSARRTILFIGDGSFQIACQELSSIIRLRLTPIIFIICNQGYTIERFVHGPEESYHDIQSWRYKDLPSVFGATDSGYQSHIVHTMAHLEGLLSRKTFKHPSLLQIVELHISQFNAPLALLDIAQSLQRRNK